jgi:hypothetical protein
MEFEEISQDEVEKAISEELASIIKNKYGKDIYAMDRKELHDFLLHALPSKHSLIKNIFWWGAKQLGEYTLKASFMPLIYILIKNMLL